MDAPAGLAAVVTSPSWEAPGTPGVAVVVSTHDRAPFLPGLLDALAGQTLGPDRFEVVLVDDASTDGTWQRVTDLAARTPLRLLALRLESNRGQGTGRNAGVACSRAPLVAFTDDDCIPDAAWLEKLTRPLLDGPDRAGAPHAVVQGRTVAWAEDAEGAGAWARTVWVLRPTWLFETCNVAYRRQDFDAAGGFAGRDDAPATRSGKAVGEDALLGWRVTEAGASLTFVEDAVVYHRHLPASYLDWVVAHTGKRVFPALVRRHRFGRRVLWAGPFLAPRTAAFDLAVIGGAMAMASGRPRWTVAAAAPWLWLALPEAGQRGGRHPVVRLGQLALGDLVGCAALVTASVRWRRLVL